MGHDDGREQCFCRDWHGCIMAQSIVGSDNVQPYKFSDCSKNDYINELRVGQGLCLLNKPNEVNLASCQELALLCHFSDLTIVRFRRLHKRDL